jgi:protein TonB
VSQAAQENWESRLLGRLLAVRRYPPEAAARDQQGIADVRVTIAADGQVVRASLVKSSGYPVLDTEALAWIRRASPLPPPPGAAPVTLVVPLRFHIDDADDPA